MYAYLGSVLIFIYYLLFCCIKETKKQKGKGSLLPAPYEFPIVGSTFQVLWTTGFTGQHFEKVQRMCKKYGPTMYFKTGILRVVLTEDSKVAKHILSSPDWSDRMPSHPKFKQHTLFKNLGITFSSGETHKELRRFTIKALKNSKFGDLNVAETCVEKELRELYRVIDQERNSNPNQQISMEHLFKISTFNIIWRNITGESIGYDNQTFEKLITAVGQMSKISIGLHPEWAFPFLENIPGCSPTRSLLPSLTTVHDFFTNILDTKKLEGKSHHLLPTNFVEFFINQIENEKDTRSVFTDDQFIVTCADLLYASLDTTSSALDFGIFYMNKFPDIQRKARDEIDVVVGRERLPTIADMHKLKYCEAIMWETLRIANVIPINGRTSVCDTTIGGFHVPKDTLCAINTTVIHNSIEIWGDPNVFRPERFIDIETGNIIHTEKLLAFGGGQRSCPGISMAKIIWMRTFTGLLHRYDLELEPTQALPRSMVNGGMANSLVPYVSIVRIC